MNLTCVYTDDVVVSNIFDAFGELHGSLVLGEAGQSNIIREARINELNSDIRQGATEWLTKAVLTIDGVARPSTPKGSRVAASAPMMDGASGRYL